MRRLNSGQKTVSDSKTDRDREMGGGREGLSDLKTVIEIQVLD